MTKIKGNTDKFESLEEFIDNLNRGGEIEFFFNEKKYSISQPEGNPTFIEQGNENSLRDFNNVNELLEYKIDNQKISDIVTLIQPFFRCF
jgi:hypothetical protein